MFTHYTEVEEISSPLGVGKFWGGGRGGGWGLGGRWCPGTTWQKYLNMVPAGKHCPVSSIQSCLWFTTHWEFGFDLQGTEKTMNLFKRKTTLQKAACSKGSLATVFCYFWLQTRTGFSFWKISFKKKMSWRNVKLTSQRLWLHVRCWRNQFLCL